LPTANFLLLTATDRVTAKSSIALEKPTSLSLSLLQEEDSPPPHHQQQSMNDLAETIAKLSREPPPLITSHLSHLPSQALALTSPSEIYRQQLKTFTLVCYQTTMEFPPSTWAAKAVSTCVEFPRMCLLPLPLKSIVLRWRKYLASPLQDVGSSSSPRPRLSLSWRTHVLPWN